MAEGCPVKLDVYPAVGAGPTPVLVWIHGGALISGGRALRGEARTWLRERCVSAGYTVVSIDYRLAPETKLPAIVEDVQDAFRWVRGAGADRFNLDPDRIGVLGHSAGGYLTLMSGYSVEPRPNVLVSFYGYGDLIGEWYS
ncbi:MAG: hypothetical protein CL878_07390, partial [Dehalococcoidia bacterium]|nr:hypothetical protein [Dehalococcoidia bacterium]